MDSGRIVILSDTHLGRRRLAARSADALRGLWQDAAHVIVNGDVAEMHHRKHRGIAAREVLRLFDLCDADGVALTLLSGNHDPYLTDMRHLLLADGQVLVTHGDVLHPAVAPWSPAARRIRQRRDEALASLEPDCRDRIESVLSATQFATQAEWSRMEEQAQHSTVLGMLLRPWAIAKVFHFWHVFPGLAAAFTEAHAPQARFVLVGHTHRPGIWTIDSRTIINTGSFGLPGHPRAVTIDDSMMQVWRITRERDRYRLARRPLVTYDLKRSNVIDPGDTVAANPSAA